MFGMGTGGTSLPSSPLWLYTHAFAYVNTCFRFLLPTVSPAGFKNLNLLFRKIDNYIANCFLGIIFHITYFFSLLVKIIEFFVKRVRKFSLSLIILRSSPRPISIGQLHTLLHLHSRPINLVVYKGSYQPMLWDTLS